MDSVEKLVGDVFELGWMHKQMGEAWHGKEEYENRITHAALVEAIRGLELTVKVGKYGIRYGFVGSEKVGNWDYSKDGEEYRNNILSAAKSRAAQMFGIDPKEVCCE